jgi:O-antigen ligase
LINLIVYCVAFILSITTFGQSKFGGLFTFLSFFLFLSYLFLNLNFLLKVRLKFDLINFFLIFFILITVISNVRNNYDVPFFWIILQTMKFLVFGISTWVLFSKRRNGILLIKISAIFVVLNFFLSVLGLDPMGNYNNGDEIGNSILIKSFFNLDLRRITFPLTGGINNYGTLVGAILMITISQLKFSKTLLNTYLIVIIIICLYTIIRLDSRFVLALVILLSFFLFLIRLFKVKLQMIKASFFIFFFSPILLFLILVLLSDTSFSDLISRGNQDFATANGRFFIWAFCFEDLLHFKINHIFGYGFGGHFGSELSYSWMDIFKYSFAEPEKASTHNNLLQIIYDTGYIGLFVYIYLLYKLYMKSINDWYRYKNIYSVLMIIYILYVLGAGTTEALFADSSNIYFFFFVIIGYESLKVQNLNIENNNYGKFI